MLLLRAITFTVLIPGSVAFWIPSLLSDRFGLFMGTGLIRYAGILPILAGLTTYLISLLKFLNEGKGTPAIWFTKPVRFIIGEEPVKLVHSFPYGVTRNPMYVGVLLIVTGQGLLLGDGFYFIYAAILLLLFHLVVVFIEEPHLRGKHGGPYEAYCESTPRWIGKPRSWK